ncbi:MAG: sodium-dependent transporter [Halobacteria archaeon]
MAEWSSRLGFIFAAIGGAVGVGNIWRFPIAVENNGGGAFVIAYLICTFCFGLPLMIISIGAGRKFRKDIVSIFEDIFPISLGWVIIIVTSLILSYYMSITGWVLGFILISIDNFNITFQQFTNSIWPLLAFVIVTLMTGAVLSFEVDEGIERITSLLIPIVFVIIAALAVYATTMSGFAQGASFLFIPDNPGRFMELTLWDKAFGQAFFSSGVTWGILITFGIYLDSSTNIPKTSFVITLGNSLVAILGALAIFPTVFTYGNPAGLQDNQQLAFVTLPKAFLEMPGGYWVGILFYLLLFFAAFSSAIAIMEVPVAVGVGKGYSRKKVSALVTGFLLVAGFPSALSYTNIGFKVLGTRFFDFMDSTLGSIGLPISGIIISIGFTWYADIDVSRKVEVIIKYILPVLLFITAVARFLQIIGQ